MSTTVFDCQSISAYVCQMGIGSKLRAIREHKKWTLEHVYELSGVDDGTLSAIEKRDSQRSKYFPVLAKAYGVTVEQLQTMEIPDLLLELDRSHMPRSPDDRRITKAEEFRQLMKNDFDSDPYAMIEEALRLLIVVGKRKEKLIEAIREAAEEGQEYKTLIESMKAKSKDGSTQ